MYAVRQWSVRHAGPARRNMSGVLVNKLPRLTQSAK